MKSIRNITAAPRFRRMRGSAELPLDLPVAAEFDEEPDDEKEPAEIGDDALAPGVTIELLPVTGDIRPQRQSRI